MQILILKFGALGDVVRTAYILTGLMQKYPKASISWLTSTLSSDLLRFNPYIENIYIDKVKSTKFTKPHFDLVISLDDEVAVLQNLESITFDRLIGAYLNNGVTYYTEDAAIWFDMGLISNYGKAIADELKKKNTLEHNDILARMLNITVKEPLFYNSFIIEHAMRGQFDRNYFCIALNSGSGARWASKQLRIEEATTLIRSLLSMRIQGKPAKVYLLGGMDEIARHRAIIDEIRSPHLHDTGSGNTLLQFAAIIKNCDYVITSDSLALHLAIAQGIKNTSFYAPTSATEIGTFGTGVKVVSLSDDYCSYDKDADTSTITAERILEAFTSHVNS